MPCDSRSLRQCDPQIIEAQLQLVHQLPAGHKEQCEVIEKALLNIKYSHIPVRWRPVHIDDYW